MDRRWRWSITAIIVVAIACGLVWTLNRRMVSRPPRPPEGEKQVMASTKGSRPDPTPPDNPAHPRLNSLYQERYPNLEAPDRVQPEQQFSLLVSLTKEQITPGVQVQPGPAASASPEGRLRFSLPAPSSGETWKIDVVLTAPDFDLAGGSNQATIELPVDGDSTPARFQLKAKSNVHEAMAAKVSATLWHQGTYLARALRTIQIAAAPGAMGESTRAPAALSPGTQQPTPAVSIDVAEEAADLTVWVQESHAGRECTLSIQSPYLHGSSAPCTPADELRPWLMDQYAAILRAAQSFRGVTMPGGAVSMSKLQVLALLRGIGRELYRRTAGSLFDDAFWKLVDRERSHPSFHFRSIQVYTNNPAIPWELMVPARGSRARAGFLGTEFRLARWHITEELSAHEKPPQRMALLHIAAIVPSYSGGLALAHQKEEISTLEGIAGYERVAGRMASIRKLLQDPPEGIVHFAGHGAAEPGGASVDYAIQLEDARLDLMSWRGVARQGAEHRPLYFINACDVGQTNRVLNFVDGWAPTVLDGGASGFIGGLWPLADRGAAGFAARFYQGLREAIAGKQGAVVTELLERSRKGFFETGDPTFLGYVFYGDVNLRLDTQ